MNLRIISVDKHASVFKDVSVISLPISIIKISNILFVLPISSSSAVSIFSLLKYGSLPFSIGSEKGEPQSKNFYVTVWIS